MFAASNDGADNEVSEDFDSLVEKLKHPKHCAERDHAARILGELGDLRTVEPLIKALLSDPDEVFCQTAAKALGKLGDPRALEPLLMTLNLGLTRWRRLDGVIIWALGELGDLRAVEPLTRLLMVGYDHPGRRFAAEALGKIGDPRSVETLRQVQENPFTHSVRKAVEIALRKIEKYSSVESLIHKLENGSKNARVKAVELLDRSDDERAINPLSKALSDPDEMVRIIATNALVKFGERAMTPPLENGSDNTRAQAAEVLGRIGDERAIEPLVNAMSDQDEVVRNKATDALVKFGESAVSPLIHTLENGSERARAQAAILLGRIGDERAINPLSKAMGGPDKTVRNKATDALGKFRDWDAVDALFDALKSPNEGVRKAAAQAIETFGKDVEEMLAKRLSIMEPAEQANFMELFSDEYTKKLIGHLIKPIAKRIKKITGKIQKNLAKRLGLSSHPAVSAGSVASYGGMSMGFGMRLELKLEQKQELLQTDKLEIDSAESLEDAMMMLRTLNFLVHHEMGHFVREEIDVPEPKINVTPYQHIDPDQAQHNANEIMLDKLAFEMARKVYVYVEDETQPSKNKREAISIHSYLALSTIVLRNHTSGSRPMPDEVLTRMIAVLQQMAASKAIAPKTKAQLKKLAQDCHEAIAANHDDAYLAEIEKLIRAFRSIFRRTQLQI